MTPRGREQLAPFMKKTHWYGTPSSSREQGIEADFHLALTESARALARAPGTACNGMEPSFALRI